MKTMRKVVYAEVIPDDVPAVPSAHVWRDVVTVVLLVVTVEKRGGGGGDDEVVLVTIP